MLGFRRARHGLPSLLTAVQAFSPSASMAMASAHDAKPSPTKHLIEKKLTEGLSPTLLHVEDVSHKHAGHAGAPPGSSETHFNVTVVSDQFHGRTLLKRHRLVYDLLQEELQHGGVHALSLNTRTPAEAAPKP